MNFGANSDSQHDELGTIPIYSYNDDVDPKENPLNFSFDHIYTITPENVTFLQQPTKGDNMNLEEPCSQESQEEIESLRAQLKSAQMELNKLKKLASIHLDLIHRQNNLLTSKDMLNQALLQENEKMIQMEKENNL